MKLCIDCRYYGMPASERPGRIRHPGDSDMCVHPSTISEIDPTDGKPIRYAREASAYSQRQYPHWFAVLAGRCGSRARFFEAKEAD